MEEEKEYGDNFLGFVVRIIDEKTLIIDVGEDSLTVGDEIQVYEPSDEIFDLNDNSLGIYENIKESLEVVETSTFYSVCKKITRKTKNVLDPMINLSKTIISEEPLNVDKNDIKPLVISGSKVIKIGDPVKRY